MVNKCIRCGNDCYSKNKNTKYCKECFIKVKNERSKKWNELNCKKNYSILRICKNCDKIFITRSHNQRYCSKECRKIIRSKYANEILSKPKRMFKALPDKMQHDIMMKIVKKELEK